MSTIITPATSGLIQDILKPAPVTTSIFDDFLSSSLASGWTASQPAKVTITNGILHIAASSNGYYDNHVYRVEQYIDSKSQMTVKAGTITSTGAGPVVRRQSSGACYVVNFNISNLMSLYHITAVGGVVGPLGTYDVSGVTFSNGFILSMETIGISPTTIIVTLTDLNGLHLGTIKVSDNTAACQLPGSAGVASWTSGTIDIDSILITTRAPYLTYSAINILAIGDSITAGTGTSGGANTLPNQVATKLATITALPVSVNNQGVSGKTTVDWLPAGSLLTPALASGQASGSNVAIIMLGTNDSKETVNTSLASYLANLTSIANQCLLTPGIQSVVLNCPPYHGVAAPDFYGTSLNRLMAYNDNLYTICTGSNGKGILLGDQAGFGYIAHTPALLGDNIHPTDTGAAGLGGFQARALKKILGL